MSVHLQGIIPWCWSLAIRPLLTRRAAGVLFRFTFDSNQLLVMVHHVNRL